MFKLKGKYSLEEIHTYVSDITELQQQRDNATTPEETAMGNNLVEAAQRCLERLLENI